MIKFYNHDSLKFKNIFIIFIYYLMSSGAPCNYLYIPIWPCRHLMWASHTRSHKTYWVFVPARTKIPIYFSQRTYFFFFFYITYLLFKTLHIRFFILHYILLKYHFFLNFLNCFSFFTYNNHHLLSSFILEIRKERINN